MSRAAAALIFAASVLVGCSQPPVATSPARRGSTEPFQHVVLIVIDTLRADQARAAATPNLDRIAATGGAVDRAWSAGTWTVPSMVSMFTGSPIRRHGWDLPAGHIGKYPVVPATPLLAEVLRDAGFRTSALVGNPYLTRALGFDRGFDHWARVSDKSMLRHITKDIKPHLSGAQRQFIYLHLMGPHSPLRPSREAIARHQLQPDRFNSQRGLQIGAAKRNQEAGIQEAYRQGYRAVVEDTDKRLGEILNALKGLGEDTLYIVTSDHGELLGEHGTFGHGRHLWEPLTEVPLIIGGVDGIPNQMGIEAIPDLISRMVGLKASWPVSIRQNPLLVSQREGLVAISPRRSEKWIWNESGAKAYDLTQDPGELAPHEAPKVAAQMRREWEQEQPKAPLLPLTIGLSEQTMKDLKAIGYAE